MMYVCLWSPSWSTDGVSADPGAGPAHLGPLLADLVPRLRVDREVVWADGRGLDAEKLSERLVERAAELGVPVRAGVAAVPVAAELAARLGGPTADTDAPTPFLVKERTGWGWRRTLRPSSTGSPAVSGTGARPAAPPATPEGRKGREGTPPGTGGGEAGRRRGAVPVRFVASHTGPGARESSPGPWPGDALAAAGGEVAVIPRGEERKWLAGLPVGALRPDTRLSALMDGVALHTLGDLAVLEREAVEVRLGATAVRLWRLARGDDRRLLFDRIPPERPHGSIDFVDYVLTDPSRLLFTANALLGPLCDRMTGRGEHARALRLTLPLGNGDSWRKTIRPARPTASRDTWLRMIRELLDRLTVPDAVAGMRLEVMATEEATVRQGDLFDRGFATAAAVDAAVARLAERQVHPLRPASTAHPLLERRGGWRLSSDAAPTIAPGPPPGEAGSTPPPPSRGAPVPSTPPPGDVAEGSGRPAPMAPAADGEEGRGKVGLGLQCLPDPRRVGVETMERRDHVLPVRVRHRGRWREVTVAAGPDRISGGQWEASSYAREYYRCVTDDGMPLWIYRDALDGGWYLQGWWD